MSTPSPTLGAPGLGSSIPAEGAMARGAGLAFLIAALLSAAIVYFPWEDSLGQTFPDRDAYLEAISAAVSSGATLFDVSTGSLIVLALNEFLWRQILIFIGTYFPDPSVGLSLVSLLAATLTAYRVIRRTGGAGYAAAMLFSPLAVDLFVSQIRSALALGVFVSAMALRRRVPRNILFAIAFFIHSFAAVLFAIYLFDALVLRRRQIGTRVKVLMVMGFGVLASVVWAFLASALLTAVGDRRAFYSAMAPATLSYALWWAIALALLLAFVRLNRRHDDGHFVLIGIILLSMFVFSTLFGAAGLRFLSLALPFFFIGVHAVRAQTVRIALLAGTIAFNCINVLYWLP
jgi:hypothetical protein